MSNASTTVSRKDKGCGVLLLGHHEKHYPRNRTVMAALRLAGFEVMEAHSLKPFPWRHADLFWQAFKLRHHYDLIWVSEGGHRLVPLVRLWAISLGKTLVFDPFLSRYNTRVEDRGLHSRSSLQALICLWQDFSSTQAAQALVFDTHEHAHYFQNRYRINKPFHVFPVGIDEEVFQPFAEKGNAQDKSPAGEKRVLFYGTYIPLQGIEHILEAARILEKDGPRLRFTLIGEGQTYAAMRERAAALALSRVDFLPSVPSGDLPGHIAASDLALGIFGTSLKAANVVPNKVVQAAAMGATLISADTPAIRRYFQHGENIWLVPPGDAKALAAAIRQVLEDRGLQNRLRAGARKVFLTHFALSAQAPRLGRFLADTHARGKSRSG